MKLSIITTPRAFTGGYGALQENAMRSWLELPATLDIVFLDPDTVLKPRLGVNKIVRGFERNKMGYTTMRSLFRTGEKNCLYDHIAFINSDIILIPDFISSLKVAISLLGANAEFLLTAGRYPIEPLSFKVGGEAWQSYKQQLTRKGSFFIDSGQDVFVFTRGLWDKVNIPPFGLGGAWWDNWFCWAAEEVGATVIDISPSATILHPRHDPGTQFTKVNERYNASLYQDIGWYPAGRAPYYLRDGKLIKRERIEEDV